ncbi:MAG: hypothetical protein PHV11_07575 [Candidatus Bipolaricaulis sp.]|nr:hypothetical protein [Candidatus Bipolaricaulis sp.]
MAWANPRTWSVGEVVTAAIQNAHIRDLFRYLKGLDGVPTIESGLVIDNTDGDEYLKLPLLSTAEAASVLGAEAKVAFDEQTHDLKWHNGSAVISAKDAASLYIASQAAGDQLVASSASAWKRVAKGAANYYWRMKADSSEPEWGQGTFNSKVIYGSRAYGSGSGDVAITGAGFAPVAVQINAYCFDTTDTGLTFFSWGHGDSAADGMCSYQKFIGTGWGSGGITPSYIIYCLSTTYGWTGVVKTMDADGCTLTLTMGANTTGTLSYEILFLG